MRRLAEMLESRYGRLGRVFADLVILFAGLFVVSIGVGDLHRNIAKPIYNAISQGYGEDVAILALSYSFTLFVFVPLMWGVVELAKLIRRLYRG